MFKWETLREIGVDSPRLQSGVIPGRVYEVELTSGAKLQVWRADDGRQYFCHGLTFGGKEAPGGAVSPYGKEVPTILRGHYTPVPESAVTAGDILVWHGIDPGDILHSAIVTQPVRAEGQTQLDYSTRLQTKNGFEPETNTTLWRLVDDLYGERYTGYRRR
jgi:hypothetical protein